MDERRRFRRRAVEGQLAIVPAHVDVRVLDISVAGVLLQSGHPIQAGTSGRLRLNLGGTPFAADVEIQRVLPAQDTPAGYCVGATFVALEPDLRDLIERFIAQ